jgi:hypothetical protein
MRSTKIRKKTEMRNAKPKKQKFVYTLYCEVEADKYVPVSGIDEDMGLHFELEGEEAEQDDSK